DALEHLFELRGHSDEIGQFADLGNLVGDVVHESVLVLTGQAVSQFAPDGRTALVVVAGPTPGPLDNLLGVDRLQDHDGPAHGDLDVVTQGMLAGSQRPGNEAHHARVA